MKWLSFLAEKIILSVFSAFIVTNHRSAHIEIELRSQCSFPAESTGDSTS